MKKYLTLTVTILLVASVFGTMIGTRVGVEEDDVGDTSLSGGSVAGDPIEITNWTDLNDVRDNLIGDYVLMNNLDENTEGYETYVNMTNGWDPIGNYSNSFNGAIDGNGYEIRNLYINRPDEYYIGLFGATGDGAEITNLGVVDADVSGEWHVGALVGRNSGMVSDSYARGNVSGNEKVGGLVGWNEGTLVSSYAIGSVSGEDNVGGLAGVNEGAEGGTVGNSYATGDVIGDRWIGGLVGANYYTVENSYATVEVSGVSYVGGLVGWNDFAVSNSYAIGEVSGQGHSIGGLIGFKQHTEATVEGSFWNIESSGIEESDGGTRKTTEEMIKEETFTDAGWDFEEDWDIIEDGTYPFLRWQEEDSYPNPTIYSLTVEEPVGNGEIYIDGGLLEEFPYEDEYYDGEKVVLSANSAEGWYFERWTGDHDSESLETELRVDDNKEVSAKFKEVPEGKYVLSITIEGEGTTDPKPGEYIYEEGKVVEINALPSEGWEFSEWGVIDEENPEIEITIDEDKEITAIFKEEEKPTITIPGFTSLILLLTIVIAVAIYQKKGERA